MANSPIQVVLNSNDFIESVEKPGGGDKKDFFAGNDKAFAEHKNRLSQQLKALDQTPRNKAYSDVSFAKVIMRQSALAKSHRPTGSLFTDAIAPVVGAGDLGELFVELNPNAIRTVTNRIMEAEPETRMREKDDGKQVPHPTNLRSEVGAIETIAPYTASDKRRFELPEGLKWLSQSQTSGAYLVELFEELPDPQDADQVPQYKRPLFSSFLAGLIELGAGLVATKVMQGKGNPPMLGIRLEKSKARPIIRLKPSAVATKRGIPLSEIDLDSDRHATLLAFLDSHPLVRKVALPPRIGKSNDPQPAASTTSVTTIPSRMPGKSYPKIGIVDGGVSDVLREWIDDRWGLVAPTDKEADHGTFIAGLVISGQLINGRAICPELDGCTIIDLDILPEESKYDLYYKEPLQFFQELNLAVKSLKAKTGVRVFNFSLNVEEHVSSTGYSLPAKLLDEIAQENDILFIISAGNTHANDVRREWPSDNTDALKVLATSRNDTIKTPAESYRNLSVSALNPPGITGIVPYALSNYSCRGPGMRIGLKPDLGHIGGAGTRVHPHGHGLSSFSVSGQIVDGCGTSYAAPHVAKTVACLDSSIEGDVSRETLMGLMVHTAKLPDIFRQKQLRDIAKDLSGFGMPMHSDAILEGEDHSVTLVFANRIKRGQKLSFRFSWPPSLVNNSKCFGAARLSVISTPPFDYRYGAEFVRVNIVGYLRQQQDDGSFKGRLEPLYLPEKSSGQLFEKSQIQHAFKWSPIKVFEKTFPKGVGPTSDWKLEIEGLARDGEIIPAAGVPFTALLTISDPSKKAMVFREMRQSLQAQGVKIIDIQTAARILPRV